MITEVKNLKKKTNYSTCAYWICFIHHLISNALTDVGSFHSVLHIAEETFRNFSILELEFLTQTNCFNMLEVTSCLMINTISLVSNINLRWTATKISCSGKDYRHLLVFRANRFFEIPLNCPASLDS